MENINKFTGAKIKQLREKHNMSQTDLARKLKLTRQSVSRYENGDRRTNQDLLFELADIFQVSIDEFFPERKKKSTGITTIYDKLQPPRQENVLNYAEKQLKKQTKENITFLNEYKEKVPMKCVHACAAGITGETLYDDLIEEDVYFYEEDIPPDADFCVLVNGDSMEPMIKNGSYAFIKSQEKVKNNTIALVILDGAGYIKRVDIYDDYIKLISLNPKYEDITVSSYNHFKIIGKVVL